MNTLPRTARGVQRIFSTVPATYELANHVLTFGMDVVWRRRAAGIASLSGGGHWVDVCTGTGEMAANLSRLAPEGTTIRAVDFSPAMMDEARKKPEARDIDFVTANMGALPFPNESIDLVTMSFAARNVNVSQEALCQGFSELYRVLAPGGRFVNLETSQPPLPLVRKCFHLYVRLFVRQVGSRISGSKAGYAYLSKTIPRFYPADVLADMLRNAGFSKVTFQRLLFGVAAIHQATKL